MTADQQRASLTQQIGAVRLLALEQDAWWRDLRWACGCGREVTTCVKATNGTPLTPSTEQTCPSCGRRVRLTVTLEVVP